MKWCSRAKNILRRRSLHEETRGGVMIEFSEMRGPNKIFGSFCEINEPNILFGPLISENSITKPPLAALACTSRLEWIIGDKICALFPWSVLYCRLLVYLDSPVFLVSICSCRLVSLKLVLFGKKMTLLQKIVCDYLVSFKTYNFLNINTSLVIPFTSKK